LTFPSLRHMLFKMPSTQLNLEMPLRPRKKPGWGGARAGAGRPRKDGLRPSKPGVPHHLRPILAPRFPVHVTWAFRREVWNLRSRRLFTIVHAAMYWATKPDFRVVHYAVEGNHMHLLVEAADRTALARGMQGLGIRIARAANTLMRRHGPVVADRYHARILRNPTMVRYARNYLLTNAHKHYGTPLPDPYASQLPLTRPTTWLLRQQK